MRSIVLSSLALASFVGIVAGCSGSGASTASSSEDATRIITGSVATKSYALDNAVVIASSSDGRRFLGAVKADGTFRVSVPTGASYRLALANSLRGGAFQAIAAISWTPGAVRTAWMHVSGTGAIAVGLVRPSAGVAVQSHGGSSDSEDGGSSGSSGGGGGDNGSSGGGSGSGGGESSSGSDDSSGSQGSCECQHAASSEADLPYDVRPAVGSTFKLTDAFLFKGPLPAAVTNVTMDGGSWRLAELMANTTFTITQADCDHAGNRSTGRDRIFVTWTNADGSSKTDHLDLRYCDGNPTTTPTAPPPVAVSSHADCEDDDAPTCSSGYEIESECDGDKSSGVDRDDGAEHSESSDDAKTTCPPGTTGGGADADGGAAGSGATGGSANGGAASGGATGGAPAGGGTGGAATGATGGTTPTAGAPGTGTTTTPPTSVGDVGAACTVTADCAALLSCTASVCTVIPR